MSSLLVGIIIIWVFLGLSILTMILRRSNMVGKIQQLNSLPEQDKYLIMNSHSHLARVYKMSIYSNLFMIVLMIVIYFTFIDDSIFILIAILFGVLATFAVEHIQYYKMLNNLITEGKHKA